MRELELKEKTSKSLLANVLDMDDDFRYVNLFSFHPLIFYPFGMPYMEFDHFHITSKLDFFLQALSNPNLSIL